MYDDIRMFMNFDESINTYGYTIATDWDYTQDRPYKGDVMKEKRRIYIHYYYSIDKGADESHPEIRRLRSILTQYSTCLDDTKKMPTESGGA